MGYRRANYPCERCGKWTPHTRRSTRINHSLQLILTVVTLGLWGFVWLALTLRRYFRGPEPWRCAHCGEPMFG